MMMALTLNGIALLIWFAALAFVGAVCYVWGRRDGREAAR